MYISTATYGGMDWHDSRTIHEQIKSCGSYNIGKDNIQEAIADDIAANFPYVECIRENILQALSEKSCVRFMILSEEKDSAGSTVYKDCAVYEADGKICYENEAVFDGSKLTLTQDFAYGQISYTTAYHVEDIPDDQLGYIVTEDFLAPAKGVDLVERLYHDIFDDADSAQDYARNLKLHEFGCSKSIVTFLVCNKGEVLRTEWYQHQKEAMRLMEKTGQTHLDGSFHIFVKCHIKNLEQLEDRKEKAG
ncbi:MAG: hypothetical protein NC541_04580 [bacterium]|nr:hypothetical protein [bacterium]